MFILSIFAVVAIIMIIKYAIQNIEESNYRDLESKALNELGFSNWDVIPNYDENVIVKSRQTLEKYDYIKFFV